MKLSSSSKEKRWNSLDEGTNQSKENAIKENSLDKRTIIPEQKAFQDGTGASVEQPSPDNSNYSFHLERKKK
jgi:hypothetical protein